MDPTLHPLSVASGASGWIYELRLEPQYWADPRFDTVNGEDYILAAENEEEIVSAYTVRFVNDPSQDQYGYPNMPLAPAELLPTPLWFELYEHVPHEEPRLVFQSGSKGSQTASCYKLMRMNPYGINDSVKPSNPCEVSILATVFAMQEPLIRTKVYYLKVHLRGTPSPVTVYALLNSRMFLIGKVTGSLYSRSVPNGAYARPNGVIADGRLDVLLDPYHAYADRNTFRDADFILHISGATVPAVWVPPPVDEEERS